VVSGLYLSTTDILLTIIWFWCLSSSSSLPLSLLVLWFCADDLEEILQLEKPQTRFTSATLIQSAPAPQPKKRARSGKFVAPTALSTSSTSTEDNRILAAMSASAAASAATAAAQSAREIASEAASRRGLPSNFYEVVAPFFNKDFFREEIGLYEVSRVFFEKITSFNYEVFLLSSANDGCNFTNINVSAAAASTLCGCLIVPLFVCRRD
jgi:hypothetical protein